MHNNAIIEQEKNQAYQKKKIHFGRGELFIGRDHTCDSKWP